MKESDPPVSPSKGELGHQPIAQKTTAEARSRKSEPRRQPCSKWLTSPCWWDDHHDDENDHHGLLLSLGDRGFRRSRLGGTVDFETALKGLLAVDPDSEPAEDAKTTPAD